MGNYLIPTAIFDCNGVLVDSIAIYSEMNPAGATLINSTLQTITVALISREELTLSPTCKLVQGGFPKGDVAAPATKRGW